MAHVSNLPVGAESLHFASTQRPESVFPKPEGKFKYLQLELSIATPLISRKRRVKFHVGLHLPFYILHSYARCHPVGPQRLEGRNSGTDHLKGTSAAE
jgi:hypothetical protein